MSFWEELKRRNVFRVGIAYLALVWLILQVADVILSSFEAPAWIAQALIIASALGFVLAVMLGWFYELTPEGIKAASQTNGVKTVKFTGRKLDFVIIGLLVLAVGFLIVDIDPEAQRSVAVLAFEDHSPDGDQEWFSDGLSEEIINSLTQLPELQVRSRGSSFFFKDKNVSLSEIAETLGVAYVIEGSVRRDGDRLRVTAQLIRVDDDSTVWSNPYDETIDDVFTIQQDLAENIAQALDVYLDDDRREKMFAVGTRDVDAYLNYLKGVKLFRDWHLPSDHGVTDRIWRANAFFEQAIKADQQFALPYFLHTNALVHYLFNENEVGKPTDITTQKALARLDLDYETAVDLAPASTKTLFQVDQIFFSNDWSRLPLLAGKVDLKRLKYSTVAPFGYLTAALMFQGRYAECFAVKDRARQENPMDNTMWGDSIFALRAMDKSDRALDYIRMGRTQFGNEHAFSSTELFTLMELDRNDEVGELRNHFGADASMYSQAFRAVALAAAGRPEEALEIVEKLTPEIDREKLAVAVAWLALDDRNKAAAIITSLDARPLGPQFLTNYIIHWFGGKLFFDLEWAPNFAARLDEAGFELPRWEHFP